MSMSRGCELVEIKPEKWYCIVAMEEYDYDFTSFSVYGPCLTADEAFDKMHNQECNPGQSREIDFGAVTPKMDKMYTKMIESKGYRVRPY